MTIIDRIFNYRIILFSVYHLLSLQLLNCVMSVLSLNSYWIGLDWIGYIQTVLDINCWLDRTACQLLWQ